MDWPCKATGQALGIIVLPSSGIAASCASCSSTTAPLFGQVRAGRPTGQSADRPRHAGHAAEVPAGKPKPERAAVLDAFAAEMFFLADGKVWKAPAEAYKRCRGRLGGV